MKENNIHSNNTWTDPDDAPEITAELLESGVKMVGDQAVSDSEFKQVVKKTVGRPASKNPKQLVSIRYDSQVIEYFKATGKGWQTRINEVLMEYIKTH